jgi:hypothetical protein
MKKEAKKNWWLLGYYNVLIQQKYNLKKMGLYMGTIKEHNDALISILENDYDIKK